MDTKWKKCKMTWSFLLFFAGMTLLLAGALGILDGAFNRRLTGPGMQEMVRGDYQETREFRHYISGRLEDFLDMATGAPVGGYYWNYYDEEFEKEMELEREKAVVQEYSGNTVVVGGWDGGEDYVTTPEQNKKMAERLHSVLEKNKNLLYTIAYNGEVLYTNADGLALQDAEGMFNKGYNFLLDFNGSEVKIIKNGQEVDVYGDGYYRNDSHWYVPGYKNFAVSEEMKKASVTIAAAQTPERYIYSDNKQSGYRQAEDELYWIKYHMEQYKESFVANMVCLFLGILLLVSFRFLRKSSALKKEAETALAGLLGRIWLEAKVILAVLILLITTQTSGYSGVYLGVLENITWVSQEAAYSGNGGSMYLLSEIVREFTRLLFSEPTVLIILFWLIYFAVLDIRKNKKVWKQSLTAKIIGLFRTGEMGLPFSKKLVRRCIPGAAASTLFCLVVLTGLIFSDSAELFLPALLLILAVLGIQYYHVFSTRKLAADMDTLAQRVDAIHDGDYAGGGMLPRETDLAAVAAKLEDIRQGMEKAIDEQVKSQRMKVELIANVSHDIKTPLTSIISYVQFLKQEEDLPEHVKDYVRILDEKSERLKNMVQDVFAVSKAASGQLAVNMEQLDFGKLLRQTMADMEEQIRNSSVTLKAEIPEQPVMIEADGQKLYRVFQNLIQNALKYSLEGSRVYITMKADGDMAVASVTNTSRWEIDAEKDFTERFVRGDESRTDGGSGLGLSIARNFTEACGGSFKLETIADLFVVTISFHTV